MTIGPILNNLYQLKQSPKTTFYTLGDPNALPIMCGTDNTYGIGPM